MEIPRTFQLPPPAPQFRTVGPDTIRDVVPQEGPRVAPDLPPRALHRHAQVDILPVHEVVGIKPAQRPQRVGANQHAMPPDVVNLAGLQRNPAAAAMHSRDALPQRQPAAPGAVVEQQGSSVGSTRRGKSPRPHDRRAGMGHGELDDASQRVRFQQRVLVQQEDKIVPLFQGPFDPSIAGRSKPLIAAVSQDFHAWPGRLGLVHRPVRRTVVHHHDSRRWRHTRSHRCQALLQVATGLVDRDHHGNAGRIFWGWRHERGTWAGSDESRDPNHPGNRRRGRSGRGKGHATRGAGMMIYLRCAARFGPLHTPESGKVD